MQAPTAVVVVMGDSVPLHYEDFCSMLECSLPLRRNGAYDLQQFHGATTPELQAYLCRYACEHGISLTLIQPHDAYVRATHLFAFFKADTVKQRFDPGPFRALVERPRLFLL